MKKMLCILLIAVLMLSSTACTVGGGKATKKLIILTASDGEEGNKVVSPYIPGYQKKTGIEISFTEMAMDALHTKLSTLFAANATDVDIIWSWAATTAEYASAGHLQDITDKLKKDEWSKYVPGALSSIAFNGRYYGLPKFHSVRSFYYNQALFDKAGIKTPPTNWDELIACAKATTNPADDEYGLLFGLGSNNNFSIAFQEMLVLTNGQIADDKNTITFNNEAGVEALERIVELAKLGVIDPASYGINSGPVKRERWIKGKDAMTWEWAATYKVSNDPATSKIVGKCIPIVIPAIKTSGAITGPEGYVISKYSKNIDASLELLKYFASADIQKQMTLKTGWYPVVNSVFEDKEVLAMSPLFGIAAQQSKFPTMRFAAPYSTELENAMGPEILLAIQGKKSAKQALDDAAKKAEPIVAPFR